MLFLYHYSMAHTIIHPLTQSPPPRRTRRNRLQEVQRSCCCFAMTVRTSWMSLFKQDKYYYFSDRSGYRLFKPNGIKSLLFLSTSTHFCLTQLPFTVISVRCAEAELRWHFFFFFKAETRCVFVYELCLLTFFISEFALTDAKTRYLSIFFLAQVVSSYFCSFPMFYSNVCGHVYAVESVTFGYTRSNCGRGSVLLLTKKFALHLP